MRRRGGGGGAAGVSTVVRTVAAGALLAGTVVFGAWMVPPSAAGDPGERGYPLVHTLVPDAPGADVQNFDVAVDPRGFVYAANSGGVLIHDGAWWRRVSVGEAVSAFSLAIGPDGRVAVGGVGEIGYLTSERGGAAEGAAETETETETAPRFVSLVDRLPEELHDFSQVLRVVTARQGFVFATESWLVWWDGGERLVTLGTHPGVRPFTIPFRVGDEVYAWGPERGLERIAFDGDTPSLEAVAGGELFVDRRVDA
ncbi:MAG TPA: hypothetical protein VKU40_01060, partial [Thermoanaerobaculia bacterium]|nr:hypothetical protein [Thermoanaerobaculia bacterium]